MSERDKIDLSALDNFDPDFDNFKALLASGRITDVPDLSVLDGDLPASPGVAIDLCTEAGAGTLVLVGLSADELTSKAFVF
jgi:hypothetical protein